VVFFRKQDALTDDLQKKLAQRLGELSGKPKTSGLHIHPVANSRREISVKDDEISVINSEEGKKLYNSRVIRHQTARKEWHSDITFEPIPSDYTILRLTVLPRTGGGKHQSSLSYKFTELIPISRYSVGFGIRVI
jgi:alpha-ketoglutarate-dependent taurine dioxygenase